MKPLTNTKVTQSKIDAIVEIIHKINQVNTLNTLIAACCERSVLNNN